jgi:hypothetical protein
MIYIFLLPSQFLLRCIVPFAELQVFPEASNIAWWACVELSSLMWLDVWKGVLSVFIVSYTYSLGNLIVVSIQQSAEMGIRRELDLFWLIFSLNSSLKLFCGL